MDCLVRSNLENFVKQKIYKHLYKSWRARSPTPHGAQGEGRGNLDFAWDCGACSERSEESRGLLRLGVATVPFLAMTL